ncbi:DNA polymerase III subunit gamma/tau [Vannielia litorea]|uniref:DNA polymerase III subunit gamma/tau n=1 Tax=Vannielia litorea TaxID=1217970 RepID=UPI001C94F5BC|nr:DNA polymerase III subunit gamma/tau [Vannielia litorea]MBY6049720.1 DNA polymerase III subunit gamma/tau [Vannielia litorea]MBY6077134.1 DNA polymerase III subunit gamma/tau [Vannielia litorea]
MSETPKSGYQVLARKYRPQTFADLVGQEAMVRTLRNAFEADRIAQAFIMTGIRGTGKTTTARIIAKGLNCEQGPTTDPCGACDACVAIAEGRHVDVIEMDAASNTGIDDIRAEVLDTVHYAPANARYKVYIIDEVHMLSKSAFNALLKTLEEPPAHAKFIFATTEIRKVPVTVLSRCQRFDLRRIEPEDMIALMRRISEAEGGKITDDALALLARASEGSARDATSLLDQALGQGGEEASAETVRAMLGLADRGRVLDLFEMVLRGDASGALGELAQQYAEGADPMAVLRDLAEVTHWVSVTQITPDAGDDPTISPDERDRGRALAESISMRVLSRMWQMLLKSLEEVSQAPNAMMAAEMAIIRLTHVSELPTPDELIRKLKDMPPPPPPGPGGGGGNGVAAPSAQAPAVSHSAAPPISAPAGTPHGTATALAVEPEVALARYGRFEDVVELIRYHRDVKLLVEVETTLRLARYQPGRIEFEPTDDAAPDLAARLGGRLQTWTGVRWGVSVVGSGGGETIAEVRDAERMALETEVREHPLVQSVLAEFPGAKIREIRTVKEIEAEAAAEALPEVDDEWDPFEED